MKFKIQFFSSLKKWASWSSSSKLTLSSVQVLDSQQWTLHSNFHCLAIVNAHVLTLASTILPNLTVRTGSITKFSYLHANTKFSLANRCKLINKLASQCRYTICWAFNPVHVRCLVSVSFLSVSVSFVSSELGCHELVRGLPVARLDQFFRCPDRRLGGRCDRIMLVDRGMARLYRIDPWSLAPFLFLLVGIKGEKDTEKLQALRNTKPSCQTSLHRTDTLIAR
jgi:hypothetical protein